MHDNFLGLGYQHMNAFTAQPFLANRRIYVRGWPHPLLVRPRPYRKLEIKGTEVDPNTPESPTRPPALSMNIQTLRKTLAGLSSRMTRKCKVMSTQNHKYYPVRVDVSQKQMITKHTILEYYTDHHAQNASHTHHHGNLYVINRFWMPSKLCLQRTPVWTEVTDTFCLQSHRTARYVTNRVDKTGYRRVKTDALTRLLARNYSGSPRTEHCLSRRGLTDITTDVRVFQRLQWSWKFQL
jgi:hypothetical protein